MSIIKIENFGGLLPRVSPRALPAGAAQVNSNLLATSVEFRPLLEDSVEGGVTAASNAKTLYRIAKTGAWITNALEKSYVRGQIADDATERTYVTTNDGSTYPVATDITLVERKLGVPKPSGITAAASVTAFYTETEYEKAVIDLPKQIKDAVVSSATALMLGASVTTVTNPDVSFMAHGSAATLPTTANGEYALMIAKVGGLLPAKYAALADPGFGGVDAVVGAVTYWAIPIKMQGRGYTINQSGLSGLLKLIKTPNQGAEPHTIGVDYTYTDQLATNADCDASAADVAAMYLPTAEPQKGLIDALNAAQQQVYATADAYNDVVTVSEFYQTADPSADITRAIEVFASRTVLSLQGTGFGVDATQAANFKASVIALFGSVASLAAAADPISGELQVDGVAIRGSINTLMTNAPISADLAARNKVLADVDSVFSVELAASVAPDYWKRTYPTTYPLSTAAAFGNTVTARANAFRDAIANVRIAAQRATIAYDDRTIALAAHIDDLYSMGAFKAALPDPDPVYTDTRSYIATFVTDWGEESAPCDPTLSLTIDTREAITVTLSAAAPTDRNLTHWRLYRTNTGSAGAAFQFVAEVPILTTDYADSVAAADLGEVCPSIGADGLAHWSEPPAALRGLVGMPNGIMAGYVDNYVSFCEPYHPYAWPVAYQIPLQHKITGLGVFGQTLFVGTTANPSFISGSDSMSMSEQMLPESQACVSARSIVSAQGGVLYASPDGICFASLSGVEVITTALFSREDWQALTPSSVFAVMHEGVYYFTYTGNGGGCYALDTLAKKLCRIVLSATAFFYDGSTDALYYVSGTAVKKAFATLRRTGIWRSPKIVMPRPKGFPWLQVDGDQSVGVSVTVRWYGDDSVTPRYTATLTSTKPVRMPSGMYLEHEVEIESKARITKVLLAGSTEELQAS